MSTSTTAAPRTGTRRRSTRTLAAALMSVAAAGAVLTGCSSSSGTSNTTCGDYLDQDSEAQKNTARDLLKDRGQDDPANMVVSATQLALNGYCQTQGQDTPVTDATDAIDSATNSIGGLFGGDGNGSGNGNGDGGNSGGGDTGGN